MSAPTVSSPVPVDPARSSEAWGWLQARLAGRPVPAVLTLIGLGDLALLDALDARAPGSKVLVLEPDAARARQALAHRTVELWRRSGRLLYLAAPDFDGADQAWRIFPTKFEQPPLLVHPASASSAGLRATMAVLAKIVFGAKANADARRRFAPRYLTNSLRNLPAMVAGRDVRELSGVAQGKPAIVVGAGPSLDGSMAELKRLAPRAVVIATDTSLRPLLVSGIVPQFVIALDPSDLNGRHLLELPPCPDTWLVAESALDPRAASVFEGRTFWFRVAPHQPWPWLNELGFDAGRLEVWGSVLTAGYQLACLAGCDPIVMVGSDLSYTDGRPYARGTTYEFDWAWVAALGTPVEETWRKRLASRTDARFERDLTGTEVPTTGVLIEFRDWMVAQAKKSGRRVVNATGRGLLMGGGVEQLELARVLEGASPLPPLFDLRQRPRAAQTGAIAASLRAIAASLASGSHDTAPLAAWREFSGGGFNAVELAAAVTESQAALDAAPRGTPLEAGRAVTADTRLLRLPEALTTLRSALEGTAPPAREGLGALERAALLMNALERMAAIVREVDVRRGFTSLPAAALVGKVPAGATVMWPEAARWAVLEVEAMLAEAWHHAVPPAERVDPATLRVAHAAVDASTFDAARVKASHGCLLLVLEWLACASSLGGGAAVRPLAERLRALEALLRRALWRTPVPGPAAELVLQATAGARTERVILPLGLSEAAVACVMTGAPRRAGSSAWELGTATTATLSVNAAVELAVG